jgi:hypothetical protein
LPAMKFTESVRSFQSRRRPARRPGPPSLPLGAHLRATRVTSAANDSSWSTIVLTVFFSSRISPLHVDRDLPTGRRRPRPSSRRRCSAPGGQVAGHEVDGVGQVLPHPGDARARRPGRPSLPSVPTSRATRVTSAAND